MSESRYVRVTNATGLHLRAAAEIVKVACTYTSEIILEYRDMRADARSILSVAALAAGSGAKVFMTASGSDAVQALDALESLFSTGFGEGTNQTRR